MHLSGCYVNTALNLSPMAFMMLVEPQQVCADILKLLFQATYTILYRLSIQNPNTSMYKINSETSPIKTDKWGAWRHSRVDMVDHPGQNRRKVMVLINSRQ